MTALACEYLKSEIGARRPGIAIVLGSGLGGFADELTDRCEIRYRDIPDWPGSTAVGHAGRLIFGSLDGLPIVAMAGRAPIQPPSPMPFIPPGVNGDGLARCSIAIGGTSTAVGSR